MTQTTTTYQAGQQITFEQKYADGVHEHEGVIERVCGDGSLVVKTFDGQGTFGVELHQVKSTAEGISSWRHSEGLVAFAW